MKTRPLLTALTLALAMLGSSMAGTAMAAAGDDSRYEGRGGHGKWSNHEKRGDPMERMTRRLDLSESQQQQVRATMQAHGPELRELRRDIRERRNQIRLESANGFNEEAVRAQSNALGEAQAQAAFAAARMQADIRALLTTEQQELLARHGDRSRGWNRGPSRWDGKSER